MECGVWLAGERKHKSHSCLMNATMKQWAVYFNTRQLAEDCYNISFTPCCQPRMCVCLSREVERIWTQWRDKRPIFNYSVNADYKWKCNYLGHIFAVRGYYPGLGATEPGEISFCKPCPRCRTEHKLLICSPSTVPQHYKWLLAQLHHWMQCEFLIFNVTKNFPFSAIIHTNKSKPINAPNEMKIIYNHKKCMTKESLGHSFRNMPRKWWKS